MTSYRLHKPMKRNYCDCDICKVEFEKPYTVTFFYRDPTKTYHDSTRPFICTENRRYCKTCFHQTVKAVKKALG
jgi:hypothetical protein